MKAASKLLVLVAMVACADSTYSFQIVAQSTPVWRDGLAPLRAIADAVVPKQMQPEFSRGVSNKLWTDFIYSRTNQKLYILSLEPEFDIGKRTIGINVVLRDVETAKTGKNLLNPPGRWHGLQPYSFMADDLLHGADKSIFGAHRTIAVRNRELFVEMRIENVRVKALPDGGNEIDNLKLWVSVGNVIVNN